MENNSCYETGKKTRKLKKNKTEPAIERIDFIVLGAGNEVRTRGLDLGKVALYQLSYTRPS